MPLFDFQCSECGAFEIDGYQALRDASPPMCPNGCAETQTMERRETIEPSSKETSTRASFSPQEMISSSTRHGCRP